MANTLTQIGIETGNIVEAYHVSQSIDAFTGVEAYDITLSGSFTVTGPVTINGLTTSSQANVLTINSTTGQIYYTASSAIGGGGGGGITSTQTGSFLTTSSFNAYTGSNISQFAGTASYTNNALSASYVNLIEGPGIKINQVGTSFQISGSFRYEIGEYVPNQGGVIFQRYRSNTIDGPPQANGQFECYYVVALNNLNTPVYSVYWAIGVDGTTGATNLNDGLANQTTMLAAGPAVGITSTSAAGLADSYIEPISGKSDWYLPAINELVMVFNNLPLVTFGLIAAGGSDFDPRDYWTSTELTGGSGVSNAYVLSPVGNRASFDNKLGNNNGRAIRRFSI